MSQILFDLLFFISGVSLNMAFLHMFSFYETQHHPTIARAKRPYLASKAWGVLQLAIGVVILALCNYQFGFNLPTLFVFLGFALWAIFLGLVSRKHTQREASDDASQ